MATAQMMGTPTIDPRDRRLLVFGLAATLLVHLALVLVLSTVEESVVLVEGTIPRGPLLCEDERRCMALGWQRPRMGIDEGAGPELDIIQASVIPRLGMAEEDPKKLPQLQKYEQPEKVEDGINIQEENEPPKKPLRFKEFKKKKAQRDRRSKRPRSLDSILGAPDDDDPRRRPTDLQKIIGNPGGSVYGRGTEFTEGNEWAGKVQLALRREFRVPASIDDVTLKRLSVEVLIRRVDARGHVESYQVTRRSGNEPYNTAAIQLVQRFMPTEGGTLALPAPPDDVLDYVNRHGLVVELEGKLFRR